MTYLDHAIRLWPYLTALAPDGSVVTYKQAAQFLGHDNPRIIGRGLHPIFDACQDAGWPILTALVVNAKTDRPGEGLDAWIHDFKAELERIAAFPWEEVCPPLPLPEIMDTTDGFRVDDMLVLTKGRGPFQERFRRILVQNYRGQCALCDTRIARLLVASHIVPWSIDPDQRLNPANGILLCRSHDVLFELAIVRIHPDLSVKIVPPKRERMGSALKALLRETRTFLRLPAKDRPGARFLERKLNAAVRS